VLLVGVGPAVRTRRAGAPLARSGCRVGWNGAGRSTSRPTVPVPLSPDRCPPSSGVAGGRHCPRSARAAHLHRRPHPPRGAERTPLGAGRCVPSSGC